MINERNEETLTGGPPVTNMTFLVGRGGGPPPPHSASKTGIRITNRAPSPWFSPVRVPSM